MALRFVGYYLSAAGERVFAPLRLELEAAGVTVFRASATGSEFQALTQGERRELLYLTDCSPAAEQVRSLGIACVGLDWSGQDLYFGGAELVLMSLEGVDRRDLEEWLLRFHGLPVTIARTERLLLREITADDCPVLYQISLEPGMELAREDEDGESCFLPERLIPYAAHAYRLLGYGLWSVVLPEGGIGLPGRVIGCCGFAPYHDGFEMEFMLSAPYRRQGYGTEMCRAALAYAADRLGATQIWIRIRRENAAALRFSEQLSSCELLPIRIICE